MLDHTDYEEIRNLYARLNRCYDTEQAEDFAACFTEDARYERPTVGLVSSGRAELIELVRKQVARKAEPKRHVSMNIEIVPEGDGARGYSYHYVLTNGEAGHPPRFHATGTCEDKLVNTGDGWRFAHRLKKHDFTE